MAAVVLEREEYIEQAYFFRVLRERLLEGMATQEILERIDQEILSTTRLPYAIQFLAAEVKHSGLLSTGFVHLAHYFTPFQAYIIQGSEEENRRFSIDAALLILLREAEYRAGSLTPSGLFVYQLEVISRNRLGYDRGISCMARDPLYSPDWSAFIEMTGQQLGLVELSDIVYLRSVLYVQEQRRTDPDYEPPVPALFGEKEGKIAKANRGRDPLYLFAALQRHLGFPEVPRPRPRDDPESKILALQVRLRDLEKRLQLLESEVRGQIDLSQLGKPDIFSDRPDDV
jgi:hypothetical protein